MPFHKIFLSLSLFFALLSFAPDQLEAKIFKNAYIRFEIPDDWDCKPEQTEYVCHKNNVKSGSTTSKVEAIIILTSKYIGPSDSLQAYNSHLRQPKSTPFNKKGNYPHKRIYTKQLNIKDDTWVDALQLNSEAPNFYTRYLATVKPVLKIGVLVTFSTHKKFYTKYNHVFMKVIQSLQLSNKQTPALANAAIRDSSEVLGAPIGSFFDAELDAPQDLQTSSSNLQTGMLLLGILFAAGVVGVIIFRKRRKKNIFKP